jgi:plasmid stability protein
MADLLVRNLPADLHARLKESAKVHRRSVTQETIEVLKRGLDAVPRSAALPPLIVPRKMDSVTMEDLVRWAHEDLEQRDAVGEQ